MAEKITKVRLEIITSEAVSEDFVAQTNYAVPDFAYTKVPVAHGRGNTSPKLGEATWPEINVVFTIYCTEEEAGRILAIVGMMRGKYPDEGVACFKSYAEEL
jgi:hypothetical protein